MKERKGIIQWIKEHKTELIIAGVGVGALILVVLGIRNRGTIKAIWNYLKELIKQPSKDVTEEVTSVVIEVTPEPAHKVIDIAPSNELSCQFEVSRHIRNLPEGWHASPEKIAAARDNNIELMDGQTWVESYKKGCVAA